MLVKQVLLPFFTGFYHTEFDIFDQIEVVDSEEEKDLVAYGVTGEEYDQLDFLSGYKKLARELVANAPYHRQLNTLGVSIDVDSTILVSPREYNFTNDKIMVNMEVSDEAIDELINILLDNEDEFKAFYLDKYQQEMPLMGVDMMVKHLENRDLEYADFSDILEYYLDLEQENPDTYSWVTDNIYPLELL